MHPCRLFHLLLAMAGAPVALAQPLTSQTLSESGFSSGTVTTIVIGWGNVGDATMTPQSAGGNPGGWGQVNIGVAGGTPPPGFSAGSTTMGVFLLAGAGRTLDPATMGGIDRLDISMDSKFVGSTAVGCNCSGAAVIIRQNGVLYSAGFPNTAAGWLPQAVVGLTEASFSRVLPGDPSYFDPAQHPDFSASGAPFEIGFSRGNSNGPGPTYVAYNVTTGVDNYTATASNCIDFTQGAVTAAVCPGTTAAMSVTTTGSGTVNYQWQIETAPGVWATLGHDPMPLPCGGGAFAYAANPFDASTAIGIHACTGVSVYRVRCVATNTCGSAPSNPVQVFIGAADLGRQGGVPGPDGLYDNNDFVVFINFFFTTDARADLGRQGGVLGSDGLFDNNDFVVFINLFFASCP